MKTIVIPAAEVRKMRLFAQEAVKMSDVDFDEVGEINSPVDPAKLLAAFPHLWLKPGLVLRARIYRSGRNSNGIIWAENDNLPFREPANREQPPWKRLPWKRLPLPGTAANLMTALNGDKSPVSYLEASLFMREAWEFGASGDGCDWSTHKIIGNDTWIEVQTEDSFDQIPDLNSWKWITEPLSDWDPDLTAHDELIGVRFVTYTGLGTQRLVLHDDIYRRGRYKCQYSATEIAKAGQGYIF